MAEETAVDRTLAGWALVALVLAAAVLIAALATPGHGVIAAAVVAGVAVLLTGGALVLGGRR